jgi:hypothetical protein
MAEHTSESYRIHKIMARVKDTTSVDDMMDARDIVVAWMSERAILIFCVHILTVLASLGIYIVLYANL